MNNFDIFQQAQQTLSRNPKDQQAQFIVDLWNASKNLHTKATRLQAEVDSLKEELAIVNTANANYARKQDMLETKLLTLNPSLPSPDAWLKSLLATSKAARQ